MEGLSGWAGFVLGVLWSLLCVIIGAKAARFKVKNELEDNIEAWDKFKDMTGGKDGWKN